MSSKFSDLRLLVAVVWCRMNVLQGYYTDDTYGGGGYFKTISVLFIKRKQIIFSNFLNRRAYDNYT